MTNEFGQFLTPLVSQNNKAGESAKSAFAAKISAAQTGAGFSEKHNDFLEMIMQHIQAGQGDGGKGLQEAIEKVQSEHIHPGFLKNLQQEINTGEQPRGFNLGIGQGNLSQETLAQLTAQLENGEHGGLTSFINGPGQNNGSVMKISEALGLGTEGEKKSLEGLLQQINLALENSGLSQNYPEIHSGLQKMQGMINRSIASGEQILLDKDMKDLADELNALLTNAQPAHDGQTGGFEALQAQLRSFLNTPPGQGHDVKTQIRPDLMALLNSNNFAGFQARGKSFGAFPAKAGQGSDMSGFKLTDLASSMNALEPGQSKTGKGVPFAQILQQINSSFSMFSKLGEGTGFSGNTEELFSRSGLKSEAYAQQNAMMASSNPLGMNASTSLVTQAPQAGSTHQATQMVAAQIAKNAANGQTRQMTLYLNPPELGRVHVKMELGRDNTLKARVISEKSDTHTMLQRDIDSLSKSLEDAGIDMDQDGLEFELADQDKDFDEFMKEEDDSRNAGGNKGREDEDEEDILKTTMTWHVDPETGHARYNILA